jgi:MFS family permease
VFAELWGIPFLMKKFHIDNQMAANAGIMVLVGMGIGSMIAPFISERLRSRLKVMTWSCFLTVTLLAVVIYGTISNFYLNCLILLIMGMISGGQILYFTAVKEHSPKKASATAVAFTNSLVMASALVIPPIIGWTLDYVSSGDTEMTPHGPIRLYTYHDFQLSFLIMIALMVFGGILLKFAKEPYNNYEQS